MSDAQKRALEIVSEILTRWPDKHNGDCHLILTKDARELREILRGEL
jgi:hypothetical protein